MEQGMRGAQADIFHILLRPRVTCRRSGTPIRSYFAQLNRTGAPTWGVRFEVVDWENYSSAGIRPTAGSLITGQTLERFRSSLALVIVVMAHGSEPLPAVMSPAPRRRFEWALTSRAETGNPEVKFFFRHIPQFVAPHRSRQILAAVRAVGSGFPPVS